MADFGIRGFDLAIALLDGYDAAIFVDATPRGGTPGTLYTIEADTNVASGGDSLATALDAHTMEPAKVLMLARALGGEIPRLLVVGCEPQSLGGSDHSMGLSPAVEAAVDEAVGMVERLVVGLLEPKETIEQ